MYKYRFLIHGINNLLFVYGDCVAISDACRDWLIINRRYIPVALHVNHLCPQPLPIFIHKLDLGCLLIYIYIQQEKSLHAYIYLCL